VSVSLHVERWSGKAAVPSSLWWFWLPTATLVLLLALSQGAPDFYRRWIGGEYGLNENIHSAMLLGGGIVALQATLAARRQRRWWMAAWSALAAACCFLVFGEELSWGQHLLGWGTPAEWAELNDQGETNLHNLGFYVNELPRYLLCGAIIAGGLGLPLLGLAWPRLWRRPYAMILPPPSGMVLAACTALTGLARGDGWLLSEDPGIFLQGSEVQELFVFWYVLHYLVMLRRRIAASALEGVGD